MKFDTDRIVSLSAMLVGLASLFIILYQTTLMRESQHASVLPYLTIALQANPQGVFLTVNNTGIGPALIEDVRVKFKGKDFKGDAYDYFNAQMAGTDIGALDVDKIIAGRLIPAGSTILMVGQPGSQNLVKNFLQVFSIGEVPRSWYEALGLPPEEQRAVLEIDYASVYGDKWRTASDKYAPRPL